MIQAAGTREPGLELGQLAHAGKISSVGVPRWRKMLSLVRLRGAAKAPTVTISANMQPIDQISTGVEYLREPISTSGARYQSVTTSCV